MKRSILALSFFLLFALVAAAMVAQTGSGNGQGNGPGNGPASEGSVGSLPLPHSGPPPLEGIRRRP